MGAWSSAGDVPIASSSDGILFNDAPAGFKAGDLVTVEVNGVLTFPAPVRIRSLRQHDDKRWWAFVEGSASAVRVESLTPAVTPQSGAAPEPPGTLIPDRDVLVQFVDAMFRNANARRIRVAFAYSRTTAGASGRSKSRRSGSTIIEFDALMLMTASRRRTGTSRRCSPRRSAPSRTAQRQDRQPPRRRRALGGVRPGSSAAARAKLEALLGAATIVVESGGEWINGETGEIEPKVHLHWRLKKPAATVEELAMLYEARSLAAKLVGGDASNISIVHPIRWPGSWHRKKTPRLAKIAALSDDTEIDLEEALDALARGGRRHRAAPDQRRGQRQRPAQGRRSRRRSPQALGGDPERQRRSRMRRAFSSTTGNTGTRSG